MVPGPPPRCPKYQSLDMWRGVACLAVLVFHSSWMPPGTPGLSAAANVVAGIAAYGWLGVPVFFVISGYCITAAVDSHRRKAGASLLTYFKRRFRRIYPPYWIVLVGYLAIVAFFDVVVPGRIMSSHGFNRPWWFSPWQWAGNFSLTEMWRYHVVGEDAGWMLGNAWTLCYEEQFYFIAGMLLLLTPRRYFEAAAGVTVAVAVTAVLTARGTLPLEGFFLDGGWLQFAFGILVYYVRNYAGRAVAMAAAVLLVAVAIGASWDPRQLLNAQARNPYLLYFASSGFAAFLILVHPFDERIANARILTPLRYCGQMCYSLYLVHFPVVFFLALLATLAGLHASPLVSIPVCSAVAMAASWQFHLYVERRFLATPVGARGSFRLPSPDLSQVLRRRGRAAVLRDG